jgi:flagellar protein FlaG
MALDVLSSSAYRDTAKVSVKPAVTEASPIKDSGAVNMNITEVPALTGVQGSNQTGKEQGNRQNNGLKDEAVSEQKIKSAISMANNRLKVQRTRCEFSYDEETKRVSIKVLDEITEEVIKEIPPEETLEMVEKMWELAGLLVDEKR